MSSRMRQPSHSSSLSNSTSNPKSSFKFFSKKKLSISGPLLEDRDSSNRIYEPQLSDKIPASPLLPLPDLESCRSRNGVASPDSFVLAKHDPEYLHLHENTLKLKNPPLSSDPKKIDAVWEIYKNLTEESLQLCSSLLLKSQDHSRNALLESNFGSLDARPSRSGSTAEAVLAFQVNEQWLSAIREYKAVQESILEHLRACLVATYKLYEHEATERQIEAFLIDKNIQKTLILKWRDENIHRMKSEKLLFWEQYKIRCLNFDSLRLDLKATQKLFEEAQEAEAPNMLIREHIVARNGDTILEFANGGSKIHPILRFRVSSHLLAAASPLFAQFLSPHKAEDTPLEMLGKLPPAPKKHICNDGMEVDVYQMPQLELNKRSSLSILLHAAHMHIPKVPREVDFPVFVSIAEVCLRYYCTSPLELQVEYQWLPQWIHLIGNDNIDGFLLISYTFGLRRIFTRMSKSAILNARSEEEIQAKDQWPQAVKDKVIAMRGAKLAQVQECCTIAMGEYFRSPDKTADQSPRVGFLQLTSLPRCPRGSHHCDATNLGWLMLVYNELRILPTIMKDVGFLGLPHAPSRSLKELVDCLRLMPSAPSVHAGVCDYAAAFRSDIDDIYNSVQGLTLRDVAGRNGWALSKHAGPTEDRYDNLARDLVELEAPLEAPKETKQAEALSNEDINFRILSQLDNMDDLISAAMIDKKFYQAYKCNEAFILRNVLKAERRRTMSTLLSDPASIRQVIKGDGFWPSRSSASSSSSIEHQSLATAAKTKDSPIVENEKDLYEVSFSTSPISAIQSDREEELPISEEEAHRILWPEASPILKPFVSHINGNKRAINELEIGKEKFLLGDKVGIEEKVRAFEEDKILRDEKDRALGLSF